MRIIRAGIGMLLMTSVLVLSLSAQDVSFTATVNPQKVGLGESFEVQFVCGGGDPNAIGNFRLPDMSRDFIVVGGPNQSTSLRFVNGNYSATVTYSYYLQPRRTGTFRIPPATISYQGREIHSNSSEIEVTVGSPKMPQGRKERAAQTENAIGDQLFLRAFIDKDKVFVGEPVTVTYKVYTRVAVQNFNLTKQPRTIGFWSEEFTVPNQLDGVIETVNGKQYRSYIIRKIALFPTQSGGLEVEPLEISCIVRLRRRRESTGDNFFDRFFDDPFFDTYENVEKNIRSQAVKIAVASLPTDGQPESFRGAVGSFAMTSHVDRTRLKANETTSLKVKIEGKGNLKLLEPPVVEVPNDVDKFDPKIDESVSREAGVIAGEKTFEYLLIPRYPGERTIQPIEFSYFDLGSRKYVTLRSEPFHLQVEKGSGLGDQGRPGSRDVIAEDVRPLKSLDEEYRYADAPFIPLWPALLLYGIPITLTLGLILYRRKYVREHADHVGMRMRRATKLAERRLEVARTHFDSKRVDLYYEEVARAMWGYIQDRFVISTAAASRELIRHSLREHGIPEMTSEEFIETIDVTEQARFSPTRAVSSEMAALYRKARHAIASVEQHLG